MSYDINIYLADVPFRSSAYEEFVANSLRVRGDWNYAESCPLNMSGEGKLHEYLVEDRQDVRTDEWDWDRQVGVWVALHRDETEWCVPDPKRFTHRVTIETGAGRTVLSSVLQFLIPAAAFDYFDDVLVEDEQPDDPRNVIRYRSKGAFLAHAARTLTRWHGRESLIRDGILDGDANLSA